MGVLARGSVTDRPWGMTLGALGTRGLSGQLTVGGQYRVAFEQGVVVGAHSPLATDSAVRLALTGNLITSSQVSDITRRIATAPNRDEVDVLAEVCRLQPDQAQRLRRRLVAHRAARTFSVDFGEFVVDDAVTLPVVPGCELDIRTIIYLGARNNLSEERLANELAQLGVWFKLKPEALDDLPQFGFSEEDVPILQLLEHGANLTDLEAINATLGPRAVRAVTYSLAALGACDASATPGASLQRSGASVPPQNVARQRHPSVAPQTILRQSTTAPPRTITGATSPPETKQHKTAPLGSRSPAGDSSATRAASGSHPPATAASATGAPATGASATGAPATATSVTAAPATAAPTGRVPTAAPATSRVPTSAPATSRVATASGSHPGTASGSHPGIPRASATGSYSSVVEPATGRAPTRDAQGRPRSPSESARMAATTDPGRNRTPTPNDLPAGPRTITESSGVPREADSKNSSGATSAARTGQFPAARDRSPSGGVRAQDRSPSGGVPRARPATARPSGGTNAPPLSARTRTGSPAPGTTRPPGDGVTRARTSSSQPMRAFSTAAPANVAKRPLAVRRKQSTAATLEIEALLQKKIPMLDQGIDYFTLFGLHIGASPEDVRQTYFMLARKLHPDRLAAIGIEDEDRQAQRLMACINEAFSVLNDPVRRAEYLSILNRGGEAAVRAEEQKADEMAMKVMRAEEAFRQGEMALRREQIQQAITHFQTAVELAPNEADYQAMLAWSQFAQALDKQTVAQQTRRALIRAAESNPESPTARFYLGRVERMLGREKEALYCFYEVLRIKPNHSEATSEARILEQRLKARR